MAETVRAVYEQGRLRLLEKVALTEGQEVNISILSDRDLARAALGDLVINFPNEPGSHDDIDEETLLREIEAELTEDLRLSEAILEERREGS